VRHLRSLVVTHDLVREVFVGVSGDERVGRGSGLLGERTSSKMGRIELGDAEALRAQ
jgi:hypothetical protein